MEGSAGFAKFCEAMGSLRGLERLWEVFGGFISFGRLCHALGALAFEGCGKVLKSLGVLWEAVASA